MKIMMLTVDGGTETYKIGPAHSLVAVQDEVKFRNEARVSAVNNLQADPAYTEIPSFADRHEILCSLKITLTDAKLKKWPADGAQITALLERMTKEYDSRLGAR